jgi:hypothetical protein
MTGGTADIIQGLWIGHRLSRLERLSIMSFLRHGHDYHLYVYDRVADVPPGTKICEADEILPASSVFRYATNPSYAGFANAFRYELLRRKGGWWADSDVVCLRPFRFDEPYVFSSELHRARRHLNAAVLKAPAQSPPLAHASQVCRSTRPEELNWGDTGTRLLTELVDRFGLQRYVKAASVFCPIGYADWERVFDPADRHGIGGGAHAVHLWNEMWRRGARDKDATYDPGCLYERLKETNLVR